MRRQHRSLLPNSRLRPARLLIGAVVLLSALGGCASSCGGDTATASCHSADHQFFSTSRMITGNTGMTVPFR